MAKVYFLGMRNPADETHDFRLVKVGVTAGDVAIRVAQLQTGNPFELRCLSTFETTCARQVEHFIHRAHAADMQNLEWIRRSQAEVAVLVEQARAAAQRFEERKRIEDEIKTLPSAGHARRADAHEIRLHRIARDLLKELVPAKLQLEITSNRLRAATGSTHGIEGIVRARYVPEARRFSPQRAHALFPDLASGCVVEDVHGRFIWTRVPRRSKFVNENLAAKESAAAADAAATAVLESRNQLDGWTQRSVETEQLHDSYLKALQIVHRLGADLEDLQSELIIRMGDYDAVEPVCSFKRTRCRTLNSAEFCHRHPEEARMCSEIMSPQVRKFVYPTRSYI